MCTISYLNASTFKIKMALGFIQKKYFLHQKFSFVVQIMYNCFLKRDSPKINQALLSFQSLDTLFYYRKSISKKWVQSFKKR